MGVPKSYHKVEYRGAFAPDVVHAIREYYEENGTSFSGSDSMLKAWIERALSIAWQWLDERRRGFEADE